MFWQEITSDPQLFVGGASRLDIQQGDLGKQSRIYCAGRLYTKVTVVTIEI